MSFPLINNAQMMILDGSGEINETKQFYGRAGEMSRMRDFIKKLARHASHQKYC